MQLSWLLVSLVLLFWLMLILGKAFIPCHHNLCLLQKTTLCDVSAIACLSRGCTLMERVTGAVQENLLTVLPKLTANGAFPHFSFVAPVLCLHGGLPWLCGAPHARAVGPAQWVLQPWTVLAHRGSVRALSCLWLFGNHQASRSGCCAGGKGNRHKKC